jgi:hypothetical protein
MHLVTPWFLPLAAGVLWIGIHTVRDMPHESRRHRTQAIQLLCIAVIPLLIWLTVQISSHFGETP